MGLNGGGAEAGLQEIQQPRTENMGTQTEADQASCTNCRNASLNESGMLQVMPQKQGDENIQESMFLRKIAAYVSEIMQIAEDKNLGIARTHNALLAATQQATTAPIEAPCQEITSPQPAHGENTTEAAIPDPSAAPLRTQGNKRAKEQEQQERQEQERISLDLQTEIRARAQEDLMSRLRREGVLQKRLIKGERRRQTRQAAWEQWRRRRFLELQIQTDDNDLNRQRDLNREEPLRMQKRNSE